ncbi:MAG TPA: DHHA1 domain-containing protein, partial [Polyangiaceae bacterium LLY-WYZ-15_(1-7)]|nr:DHHA1 domain-containing protein [Polyangiaceae bacterium LLY-WYZ-15_(1-7)]
ARRCVRVQERRGVDVIVVDHHLVPDEPLPAVAFLNPHRPDCGFPYKGMCSAGLVFSLGAAIRAELGARLDLRAWLDLVALGTVADVAPLDGDNRALVRAGLRLLASDRVRPGVAALKDSARIRRGPMGAFDIAFRLAPRLNAPGRLADPTVTLELLRSRDPKEARRLAAQIEQLNDERKRIERHTTEEAIAQVEERYGPSPTHGVVAAGHGWHRGVVGISAARLVDRFDVPAIVIALEDGMGHGSGRTPEGFHLYEALAGCSEELERFGGHAAAAGLTIREERIDVFREAFSARAPRPEAGEALPLVDVELDAAYPLPTVEDLMRLEPLGEGNAQPVFAIRDAVVEESRIVADGQHLKLTLRHGRKILTAFGRDMAHRIDELGDTVTAIGHLRPDLWRGRGALELSLEKLLS